MCKQGVDRSGVVLFLNWQMTQALESIFIVSS